MRPGINPALPLPPDQSRPEFLFLNGLGALLFCFWLRIVWDCLKARIVAEDGSFGKAKSSLRQRASSGPLLFLWRLGHFATACGRWIGRFEFGEDLLRIVRVLLRRELWVLLQA